MTFGGTGCRSTPSDVEGYPSIVPWQILVVPEVDEWITTLAKNDPASARQVAAALDVLAATGPALGRPLVDRIKGSQLTNLKELRPGSAGRSELRILFCFDPRRRAILLVAGDKAGNWQRWYRDAIPLAERRYTDFLETSG